MTDPQNPADHTPPPAPSAATPPAYSAAPPAAPSGPATGPVPGKTLGIVAFVLSFFMQVIALILGIVALVQSRKAGAKNPWAVAAIIISSVLLVLGVIAAIVFFAVVFPTLVQATEEVVRQCQQLGGGVYEINGVMVDCDQILG
ncbi:DUF4190 domain-containing protein [Microbacterium aurantiacum]|uniref:DUF4190 domain-containing protein n=1 Tax=Microbacterium aurantiacum TaxID=162393 RepID=UPI004037554E